MNMPVNERLEAHALLDELTKDGEDTFSRSKARRLIEILPFAPHSALQFQYIGKDTTKSKGYSPGVGNVEFNDEKEERKITTGLEPLRIGGYKVHKFISKKYFRKYGVITIDHMMDDSLNLMDDKSTVSIIYNPRTNEPTVMRISQPKTVNLGLLILKFVSFVDWKHPIGEQDGRL